MDTKLLNLRTWKTPNYNIRFLIIVLTLLVCLAVLTRYQLSNRFTLLLGDRYDGVISTVILEHWFRFFCGEVSWSDVSYYFPYPLTIANTDAYFLNGLAYSLFRHIGLDPFISAEFVNLALKSIGFVGTYLLCKKVFSLSFYWGLLTAILFTLSNGMVAHNSRLQLATVVFFPIMAMLVWSTIRAFIDGNLVKFRYVGMVTGVFFGAWCLTCFYMAWFFTLFFSAFSVSMLVMGGKERFLLFLKKMFAHYGSVIFVLIAATISLVPFMYAFIPKSRETGVRVYEEAYAWTIPLEGILQVGQENYLFGRLYNVILKIISPNYFALGEYYNTGFPILIFFLFLLGCTKALKHTEHNKNNYILPSLATATIFTWILTLNVAGYSAWYFVFHLFPGAKALRVVSTYQIFLALPVSIIAVIYLSKSHLGAISLLLISVFLISEELTPPPIGLDRRLELNRISLPILPPKDCRVFYTGGWEKQEILGVVGDTYAHNVSAMFISQFAKIPTINGIASFNPVDWNFANPNKPDYDERILYYSKKHNLSGLCKLDLNSKHWTKVKDEEIQSASITVPFFRQSAWKGRIWDIQGIYPFESWGAWSAGHIVSFEFNMPLPEKFKVLLTARAFGENAGKKFEAYVGNSSTEFILSGPPEEKILEFYNEKLSKKLDIKIPFPASPKHLGISGDERDLGIGFISIEILPL